MPIVLMMIAGAMLFGGTALLDEARQEQAREHDRAASQLLSAAGQEFGEVHVRHYSVCHTLLQVTHLRRPRRERSRRCLAPSRG